MGILQRVRYPHILRRSSDNRTLEIMSVKGLFFILQSVSGSSVSQVSYPAVLVVNVDICGELFPEAGQGRPTLLGMVLTAHGMSCPFLTLDQLQTSTCSEQDTVDRVGMQTSGSRGNESNHDALFTIRSPIMDVHPLPPHPLCLYRQPCSLTS